MVESRDAWGSHFDPCSHTATRHEFGEDFAEEEEQESHKDRLHHKIKPGRIEGYHLIDGESEEHHHGDIDQVIGNKDCGE